MSYNKTKALCNIKHFVALICVLGQYSCVFPCHDFLKIATMQAVDAMLSALSSKAKNILTVVGCRGHEDR